MCFKNIFLVGFCFIIGIVSGNAQDFLVDIPRSGLKKGIYKNFEEFKNNSPSIELDYNVLKTEKKTAGIFAKEMTDFYYLDINKKSAKEIGRVFGFSDGKNIYINEFNPKLRSDVLFMKIGFIGNYCIFEYKSFNEPNSLLYKNKVIDMKTGKIKAVSRQVLEEISSNSKETLAYNELPKIISTTIK
ncbi:hypothetical protein [Aquimarina sp. 2201CG5-10]|uniref:hypothetical protein n=1 Tax=Aquimarina callyspongiae TaxID=3098150 RepID=UPI002AB49927|nr:hypothetical protein [Aquimarina sp. 2201CG5-10]MDY8136602.1 hypothetical protein [Aquimarina sp. 2201CG5-10]